MTEKQMYLLPEIKIIRLTTYDVITTSSGFDFDKSDTPNSDSNGWT